MSVEDTPHRGCFRSNALPGGVSLVVIATGMAYSILWAPLVHHNAVWSTPADFWATYRAAHFVGWGDLGGIYASNANFVTFPGILVVLAPVAMFTGSLGLTESFPLTVPHPSAWIVCGPVEMTLGSLALFGVDSLARRLGIASTRRAVLLALVAIGSWNTVVLWGHPEDAIAVGLACYGLVAVLDRRPVAAGWLFGAAIAFQPFVIVLVPIAVASIGWIDSIRLLWRVITPSAALLVTPLVSDLRATLRAVVEQPNFPNLDHRTPWTDFAPTLSGSGRFLVVAAGPARTVAVAGACVLAVVLRRRLADPAVVLWSAGVVLALRCLTESVMVSYYIFPACVFAGVILVKRGLKPALVGLALGAALVVFSDLELEEWLWWAGTVGGLLLLVLMAAPPLKSPRLHDDQIEVVGSRLSAAHG